MDSSAKGIIARDYLEPLGDFDDQRNVDETRQEGHAREHMRGQPKPDAER